MANNNGTLRVKPFRLIPAAYTPLTLSGEIDFDSIPTYATKLVADGIGEVFVNGTTGESLSLTTEERIETAAVWQEIASGLGVIVHVGHNCLPDCVRLATHAESIGAAAIAAMPPSFLRPAHAADVVTFMREVASAAPNTPFYYYHIPSMTHVALDVCQFIGMAAEEIPNFKGVKFTHEDLNEFAECEARWGKVFDLLFGRDELILPAMSYRATGAVGSFYSSFASVFLNIWDRFSKNDLDGASEWALYSNRLINVCKKVGVAASGKYLLSCEGIGSGMMRLPLRPLGESEQQWLLTEISRLPKPEIVTSVGPNPPKSPLFRTRSGGVSSPDASPSRTV